MLTALVLVGCGGRGTGPVTPAPVQVGVPGYAHQLALSEDVLCEQRDGRLRCRGFHPLSEDLEDAWMSYGDGFSRVDLGGLGVCGLRAGRVLCWGVEVGDDGLAVPDSVAERTCAVQTFSDLVGVREVAMVEYGGCVITAERVARCWGAPLALEDPDDMRLYDLAQGARGLAVGPYMGCALTASDLRCWGSVEGLGEELDYPAPGRSVALPIPEPAQVVVGDGFGCARTERGQVYCWGYDEAGTLGRGAVGDDPQPPMLVPGVDAIDLVASATSVCARGRDARTWCWGQNDAGQLGLGHTRRVDSPTHVPALDGALDLALSPSTLCARLPDGALRCAGALGPLTVADGLDRVGATRMPGPPATHVAVDTRAVCLVTEQGHRCYGDGGALGRGHQEAAQGWGLTAAGEAPVSEVASISPNRCARLSDGRTLCERGTHPPIELVGTHALASNGINVCVVDQARKVQCWSRFETASLPTEVPGLSGAVALDLSLRRGCAVLANGGLQCWVVRPEPDAPPPGPTTDLRDLRAVALVGERTCVLRQSGQVQCWDRAAQLSGTLEGVSQLARFDRGFLVSVAGVVHEVRIQANELSLGAAVPGVSGTVQLAAAGQTACARNEAGEVRCWGSNSFSQFAALPPTLRLELTPLVEREVQPEVAAMLECGPAPRPEEEYDEGDYY